MGSTANKVVQKKPRRKRERKLTTRKALMAFCQRISKIIGEEVESSHATIAPENIFEVINASNKKGFIVHGVKDNARYPLVDQEGVKPLTPEGGYVSFWVSGTRIFGTQLGEDLYTQDSVIFDWAHSRYNADPLHTCATLVITNQETLERAGVTADIKPNGYIKIKEKVPREVIHLIRVELLHNPAQDDPRRRGQQCEQILFWRLKEIFNGDFRAERKEVIEVDEA